MWPSRPAEPVCLLAGTQLRDGGEKGNTHVHTYAHSSVQATSPAWKQHGRAYSSDEDGDGPGEGPAAVDLSVALLADQHDDYSVLVMGGAFVEGADATVVAVPVRQGVPSVHGESALWTLAVPAGADVPGRFLGTATVPARADGFPAEEDELSLDVTFLNVSDTELAHATFLERYDDLDNIGTVFTEGLFPLARSLVAACDNLDAAGFATGADSHSPEPVADGASPAAPPRVRAPRPKRTPAQRGAGAARPTVASLSQELAELRAQIASVQAGGALPPPSPAGLAAGIAAQPRPTSRALP